MHPKSYVGQQTKTLKMKPLIVFKFFFSGSRPEGSKHNLKFQSAMWHHFKHFQSKDFFFLVAFFSQRLNYSVIII